jgi:hypothetical protein
VTGQTIDLQALIPKRWDDPGILLTIYWQVRLEGPSSLAVRIAERRHNPDTGRDLKPRDIITIVARPDQAFSDLLRDLARYFEIDGPIPIVDGAP